MGKKRTKVNGKKASDKKGQNDSNTEAPAIKIVNNVPIPYELSASEKFPYGDMEINSSFWDDSIKGNTCYSYATQWARRNNKKWKFKWKKEENKENGKMGYRFWRIA